MEAKTDNSPNNKIFEKLEVEPSFKGGTTAWSEYLKRNLNTNIPVKKRAPPGNYTVYIQFIVDREGRITDVKPLTNHGYGMETEAIRLIQNSPAWIPAMQNGKKVNAYQKQPIVFFIKEQKKSTDSSNESAPVIITKAGSM